MSLIFLLFDVTSAQDVPFDITQYVPCILHGLTSVLHLCSFMFAESKKVSKSVQISTQKLGIFEGQ